jgi:nucleoside phosphorylase
MNSCPGIGQSRHSRLPPEPTCLQNTLTLQEELDVLANSLALRRNAKSPAADGTLGGEKVVVICPKDMGRVPAAVEVTQYLESRRGNLPKLLLIVGLAGGFKKEGSEPGHTICATTVVDLAQRKVLDDQGGGSHTKFRRRDHNLTPVVRDLLHSDSFQLQAWIKNSIEKGDWPKDRRPSLHSGMIASVDEVVASDEWSGKLLKHTEKLLGVEMESGGVCAAAWRYSVPVAMLRVVSDNADPAKADDAWRRRGMHTLTEMLKLMPVKELLKLLP